MSTRTIAPLCAAFLIQLAGVSWLNAQITNQIEAKIPHSFIVDNKTLPPGNYIFRIERGSNLSLMTLRNANGENVAQFAVRESVDSHRPEHSELLFNRYGNTEFLSKVYQGGSKIGVAVSQNSQKEAQLKEGGQRGLEHTEEQP